MLGEVELEDPPETDKKILHPNRILFERCVHVCTGLSVIPVANGVIIRKNTVFCSPARRPY